MKRILILNPNTSPAMTALVAGAARAHAPHAEFIEATARFGPRYIASRIGAAVAAHAAIDAFARLGGEKFDAVILACFGDPGLAALREISPVPVIGMAEAAILAAAREGGFAIVTGGQRWVPILRELVATMGMARHCVTIRAVEWTGDRIAADPDGALASLSETAMACRRDGAEAVILGGAGLAGIAKRLAHLPIPLIDGIEAAVDAALAAKPIAPPTPPPPVETVGLAGELTALFDRGASIRP